MKTDFSRSKNRRVVTAYVCFILVVLFSSYAIINLTFRNALLTPETYTKSLEQAGVYENIAAVIETRITNVLIQMQKNLLSEIGFQESSKGEESTVFRNVLIWFISTAVEEKTGEIITRFSQSIDTERIVQDTAEQIIVRDIAWLKGEREDPRIFAYIPAPERVEQLRDVQFSDFVYGMTASSLGVARLPECSDMEQEEINYQYAISGEVQSIECTSENIAPVIEEHVKSLIPVWAIQLAEGAIENMVEKYEIKPLLDLFLDASLIISNAKQSVIEFRDTLEESKNISISLLILTVPLLFAGIILIGEKRIRILLKTYFSIGLILVTFAALYKIFVVDIIVGLIPFTELYNAARTSEGLMLLSSIETAIELIASQLHLATLYIGIGLTLITGIPLISITISDRMTAESNVKSGYSQMKSSNTKEQSSSSKSKKASKGKKKS